MTFPEKPQSVSYYMSPGMGRKTQSQTSGIDRDCHPFLIRAHHLPRFGQANYWRPSALAGDLIKGIQKPSDNRESDLWYMKDILGASLDSGPFLDHVTSIFQKFQELDPKSPIHIIVAQVDEICKGCAVGEHCRGRYIGRIGMDFEIAREEEVYIEKFLKTATQIGCNPFIAQDQIYLTESPNPKIVRRVITDADTVRRVLRTGLI